MNKKRNDESRLPESTPSPPFLGKDIVGIGLSTHQLDQRKRKRKERKDKERKDKRKKR